MKYYIAIYRDNEGKLAYEVVTGWQVEQAEYKGDILRGYNSEVTGFGTIESAQRVIDQFILAENTPILLNNPGGRPNEVIEISNYWVVMDTLSFEAHAFPMRDLAKVYLGLRGNHQHTYADLWVHQFAPSASLLYTLVDNMTNGGRS